MQLLAIRWSVTWFPCDSWDSCVDNCTWVLN